MSDSFPLKLYKRYDRTNFSWNCNMNIYRFFLDWTLFFQDKEKQEEEPRNSFSLRTAGKGLDDLYPDFFIGIFECA